MPWICLSSSAGRLTMLIVAERDREATALANARKERTFSKRVLDFWFLVGSALIVCVLAGGAFVIAEIRHINPIWVFLSLISISFFAFAKEEYRREFRSVRFILFVCVWVLVNMAVVVGVLGAFGWLWLIPTLLLEQFLFYMTAYWFFGVHPPSKRWLFQRVESPHRDD
jgi:hypothetical protein